MSMKPWVGGWNFCFLSHLTLQVSPLKGDIPPVALPTGLIQLSILQRRPEAPPGKSYTESIQLWWIDVASTCLWILSCLESASASRTPLFSKLTLLVWEEAWKSPKVTRSAIENKCRELDIDIHAGLWRFPSAEGS